MWPEEDVTVVRHSSSKKILFHAFSNIFTSYFSLPTTEYDTSFHVLSTIKSSILDSIYR